MYELCDSNAVAKVECHQRFLQCNLILVIVSCFLLLKSNNRIYHIITVRKKNFQSSISVNDYHSNVKSRVVFMQEFLLFIATC